MAEQSKFPSEIIDLPSGGKVYPEDSPLSDADKATWATYRQALRDLPANIDYSTLTKSEDITWPLLPGTELPVVAKEDEDGHVPVDQPL